MQNLHMLQEVHATLQERVVSPCPDEKREEEAKKDKKSFLLLRFLLPFAYKRGLDGSFSGQINSVDVESPLPPSFLPLALPSLFFPSFPPPSFYQYSGTPTYV